MESEKINITIDGISVAVPKGTTVYTAAKQAGIDIPIFCYHDRMPPFGACRMCLVEVENMPKLQASCTLDAREGMNIKTASAKAKKGQEGILELLLINHPLDCPICDKGGECPLQDQTLKYGPGISRFFEDKRKLKKKLPLGPVLMLDRERCIQCARCTRFGELIAGDHALEFVERGYKMEIGTHDGGPAESKFIGNTIMICPVGALTSQVYRFRARPWDNDSIESTCTLCPVGCSMILDSRDGEIMRTRSRENKDVNDVWLCDKGWFGYEHVSSPERLKTPFIRKNGSLVPASWEEAFQLLTAKLKDALPLGKVAAFGGNPLTFEENFLFQGLIRGLGIPNVDYRIGMPIFSLNEELLHGGMETSIGALENVQFASLLGLDVTEEFPLLWLRLKQAENKGAPLFFAGHFAPEVHSYFKEVVLHPPGDELKMIREHLKKLEQLGKPGAILVGSQYLHSPRRKAILSELLKFREKHPTIALHLIEGLENSRGAREGGMHPQLAPFSREIDHAGLDALSVMKNAAGAGWDFLWVAGADPAQKFASRVFKAAREKLKFLVVQDLFLSKTAKEADLVLPALSFIEKEGHFINIEGRAQKLNVGKEIPMGILSDKEIFLNVAKRMGVDLAHENVRFSSTPDFRQTAGKVLALSAEEELQPGLKATFASFLFDKGVRMKRNEHLIGMTRGPFIRMHPEEAANYALIDGTMITVSNSHGSIRGKLKVDVMVAKGTVVLPLGFSELAVEDLEMNRINGKSVEVKGEA